MSLQTRLQLEVQLLAPSLSDICEVETVHPGQRLNLSVMARCRKHFTIFLLEEVDDGFEKQDLFWSEYIYPHLQSVDPQNLTNDGSLIAVKLGDSLLGEAKSI